jgi:fucose permease
MVCLILTVSPVCSLILFSSLECLVQIGQTAGEADPSAESKIRQIIRLRTVHLLALFIFVYVGVEVTIAGLMHVDSSSVTESPNPDQGGLSHSRSRFVEVVPRPGE